MPFQSKQQTSIFLTCNRNIRAFFGLGEVGILHSMLWHFVSGSYWKYQVSSPVMTSENTQMWRKIRRNIKLPLSCSSLKILGITFAEIFLIPRSSVKIFLTVCLFKFNSSTIIWTVNHLTDRTNCCTLSTFSKLHWLFHCLGLSCFPAL